ncbi:hypothetical protein PHPALM_31297 [Phytophthora palmivora]|uniref:SS18 N-terminal domain-containing protein n=1 Tax=Phytophthora palmivora TaxID=4796 RepID=A0A2P4X2X8_9STRA|nr:hypothetical protein PHPALM_31297 [Phytophthora palmivora]
MLNVNEDMIVAAAESQAEGDVEDLLAYQRILHRDLMEMAEFIDSMFGKPQRSALLTAIVADEKVRGVQRSKEQWIKTRDQVLEEEGVTAIRNKNATTTSELAKETQQGSEGLALANQLRAHEHVTEFLRTAPKEKAPVVPPHPTIPMNLLLASHQLAMAVSTPPLIVPQVLPTSGGGEQPIRPNSVGNIPPKIALPPAHSMPNMYFAFPGPPPLMFNSQGLLSMPQWQPQIQSALPARSVVPVRPPAKTPEFKRMCESCRKRHISVRECRLVHQHTDPEWQPTQPSSTTRRRRRKQPADTEKVT